MKHAVGFALLLVTLPLLGSSFGAGDIVTVGGPYPRCWILDPPPPPTSTAFIHTHDGATRGVITTETLSAVVFDSSLIVARSVSYYQQRVQRLNADGLFADFPSPVVLEDYLVVSALSRTREGFVAAVLGGLHQEILRFAESGELLERFEAPDFYISSIDIASDGCTMAYTTEQYGIGRYNLCTHQSLSYISVCARDVRFLPDGGMIVPTGSSNEIYRFDARGNLVLHFRLPEITADETVAAIALDVNPAILWVLTANCHENNAIHLFSIDIASGAMLSTPASLPKPSGLAVAIAGGWRAVDHPSQVPPPRRRTVH